MRIKVRETEEMDLPPWPPALPSDHGSRKISKCSVRV
jgi:hypothetical protein